MRRRNDNRLMRLTLWAAVFNLLASGLNLYFTLNGHYIRKFVQSVERLEALNNRLEAAPPVNAKTLLGL